MMCPPDSVMVVKFKMRFSVYYCLFLVLTLKVLVMAIDAQWEGRGNVGSARYEPALLPPCQTIKVLSYSN